MFAQIFNVSRVKVVSQIFKVIPIYNKLYLTEHYNTVIYYQNKKDLRRKFFFAAETKKVFPIFTTHKTDQNIQIQRTKMNPNLDRKNPKLQQL